MRFLDAGARGWIAKVAWANRYRVPKWMAVDDLIQEGYLTYWKCMAGYLKGTGIKPNPHATEKDHQRTFMAYFERAFLNRLSDLRRLRALRPDEIPASTLSEEDALAVRRWEASIPVQSEAPLVIKLKEAPREVKGALKLAVRPKIYKTAVRKVLPSGAVRVMFKMHPVRDSSYQDFRLHFGRHDVPGLVRNYLVNA